jgi:hypothetical protein
MMSVQASAQTAKDADESAEGRGHRVSTIFVDSQADPNGNGSADAPFQMITLALQRARQIRAERPSRIIVRVAPGEYVEDYPIYLNISNLELRGSTHLIEDNDGLPANCGAESAPIPCVEPGTETLITPLVSLPLKRSLFTVGPTNDSQVDHLTDISIHGFVFDGKGDNVSQASGRSIFVDRTANFVIDHNVIRHGAPGLLTRFSSGRIHANFAYDDLDGFGIFAGSEIYPATVELIANRCLNGTVNGSMGAVASGAATLNQVDPNLKEGQTVYDPSLHPEQVPDKLVIFVVGNDFSGNMFGFRFEEYNTFYDTTDNQPMTANIRATVRDNLCRNNSDYGFLVEGFTTPRSNPRKFTATFDGSFEDNDCTGTGRAGVFAGFLNNGVVTRNPGYINANKYLQDSRFTLQIDDKSLSSGFDYDNPLIDPFDKQTPLNNQLTMNGDQLTGKHVTCPPGFPCVP